MIVEITWDKKTKYSARDVELALLAYSKEVGDDCTFTVTENAGQEGFEEGYSAGYDHGFDCGWDSKADSEEE